MSGINRRKCCCGGGGEPATACCNVCNKCCYGNTSTVTITYSITGITPGCPSVGADVPLSATVTLPFNQCVTFTESAAIWQSLNGIHAVFANNQFGACADTSGVPWFLQFTSLITGRSWFVQYFPGPDCGPFPGPHANGDCGPLIEGDCCGASGSIETALFNNGGGIESGDGDALCTATLTYTITVNNNRCCRCTGGNCVPTSDDSLGSGCDETNECTASQDDDCGGI